MIDPPDESVIDRSRENLDGIACGPGGTGTVANDTPGERSPMDDIENKICDIIAKEARIDRALVTDGATMDDLKIASVDLVQIVFALEEGFDITIPEEAIKMDVKNVGEVVAAVKQLVLAKSTGAKGA